MKKNTNKVDWALNIACLVASIISVFIDPASRLIWICVAFWVAANMCKQHTIEKLESTIGDLHKYIKELEDSNADIWKKYGNSLKENKNEESNSVH